VTQKILAVCTGGGAGDLLAALPAIAAMRRHFAARVDVLTSSYAAPLLAGQPAVGDVLTDDPSTPLHALAENLRARRYSIVIVFWSTPRIAAAVQRAGIPQRIGQSRRLYSYRYTTRVPVRSETGDKHSHWTDIQMDYVRALGVQPQPQDYRITIALTPADEAEADHLIERTTGPQEFVIFHAARGITAHAPHWPSGRFAQIGDALGGAFGCPVVLTGGSSEAALVAKTAAQMTTPVFDVAGKTTLRGFGALARRARVVVALDSGPMHIAAAVGAPTVGIFALRSDLPQRWRPLGPRVAIVGPEYPCPRSCRKETCRTFACYAVLDAGRVIAAAREVLAPSPKEAA